MHILLKILIVLFIILITIFLFSINLDSSRSKKYEIINKSQNIYLDFTIPKKPKLHFNDKNEYYNYFINILNYKRYNVKNLDQGDLKLINKQENALLEFNSSNLKLNKDVVNSILNKKKTIDNYNGSASSISSGSSSLGSSKNIISLDCSKNNPSQEKAIQSVLDNSFTLIQGPPGTGKTKVSVDCILSLLEKYKNKNIKILISGPSNKAVDNLSKQLIINSKGVLEPYMCRFYSNTKLKNNPVLEGEPLLKSISLEYRIYEYLKNKIDKNSMDEFILNNLETNFIKKITFNKETDVNIFTQKYNKTYNSVITYYQTLLLQNFKIICATCDTSGDFRLNNVLFDVILIDEAAQTNENITLIPIVKGNEDCKVILVGDHKQLGPMDQFSTSTSNEELNKINKMMNSVNNLSMFERLVNGGIKHITLNVQYRMYPELAVLPYQRLFYTDENVDITSCAPKRVQDKTMEKDFNKMEDFWAKTRFKFVDITGNDRYEDRIQNPDWEIGVDDQNQPLYNQKEIDTIIKILILMVRDYNIDPKDIGIIAAYSGQKNKLKQLIKNIDIIKDIEVNTVDGYQGDQKDYILFSTVRSNDKGDIGFLNDDKRVNVALTRAKYGLFVLGNRETLNNSRSKTWKDIVDFFQRQGSVIDAYYF